MSGISIDVGQEMDSKIHHFIQDLVEEYGYMVVKMSWDVKVERMRNDVFEKHIERVGPENIHQAQLLPAKRVAKVKPPLGEVKDVNK